jgi:hypothetical protein
LSSPSIFPVATLGKIDGELNEYAVFPTIQLACRSDTFSKTLSVEEMLNMLGLLLRVEQILPPIGLTAIVNRNHADMFSPRAYPRNTPKKTIQNFFCEVTDRIPIAPIDEAQNKRSLLPFAIQ